MTVPNPVTEFLSELELKEETLLAWGLSETEISEDELQEYAAVHAAKLNGSPNSSELIEELLDRKLLFRFSRKDVAFYRTRMSEGVRLLAALRQWFPWTDWRTAPSLVADYRLSLLKRSYPERSIASPEFVARLERDTPLTNPQKEIVGVLAGSMNFAEFQYATAKQLLTDVRQRHARGVIVGAGTGTGKTLAFYMPALTMLIPLIRPEEHWTKLIAIYPRNELLKDQMSEVFRLSKLVAPISRREYGRGIRIGCFYGDTPKTANDVQKKWRTQHSSGRGYVCPYLRCPTCEEQLVWAHDDIRRGEERLCCTRQGCAFPGHIQ